MSYYLQKLWRGIVISLMTVLQIQELYKAEYRIFDLLLSKLSLVTTEILVNIREHNDNLSLLFQRLRIQQEFLLRS